ncbi:MAG: NADH dehydrogenase FAD-containing subunit [Kiritimatiellae bacterium]|nr:NADH dehydrogenase FAD-containing subunit [Kiritimatiellia bacterium]
MVDILRWMLTGLTGALFVADLVQSVFYLREADRREGGEHLSHRTYYVCLCAFFGAMLFALLAPSLPLMWVAVELTTLVSAPLIAYHRSRGALEAMWKYLLICSIGIGLALFGTMLVMHAVELQEKGVAEGCRMWFKVGFVFILAGYGTKTGLAPFHTWLPDAHSEAPAPVSALLSGALLNCSFFAIARFREIMPAEIAGFCDASMIFFGILSVAVAAVFMVRQTDFKRLLAYSSVEHMGLIVILFALFMRTPADLLLLALFAHIVFHSLTKTMLFQTAGNLLLAFGTRAIASVQGLGVSMKGHAALWLAGVLFICGMPPSVLFLTELGLVVRAPVWMSALVLALLFVVFAAMMKVALAMTMGEPVARPAPLPRRLLAVPYLLFAALVGAGLFACTVTVLAVLKGSLA